MSFHRWLLTLVCLAFSLAFVACSSGDSDGGTSDSSAGEQADATPGGAESSDDDDDTNDDDDDTNDDGPSTSTGGDTAQARETGGAAVPGSGGASSTSGGSTSTDGTSVTATRCTDDDACEAEQFCRGASDSEEGLCVVGCRAGGCDDGQLCDTAAGVCERDLRCESDAGCRPLEYCAFAADAPTEGEIGQCTGGCRIPGDDGNLITETIESDATAVLCPPDDGGHPTKCSPSTRDCVRVIVCCSADQTCTEELPDSDSCEAQLPAPGDAIGLDPMTRVDLRGCFGNPNPCTLRCERDNQCNTQPYCDGKPGCYCNVDAGWCTRGCRIDGPPGNNGCNAEEEICDPVTRQCVRPSCDTDLDCSDGAMYCNREGTCLLGCRRDEATGQDNCIGDDVRCNDARNCVPIQGVAPCESDEFCVQQHGLDWYCTAEPGQDEDCDGQDCCVPPCAGHDDCTDPALACIERRCVEGCRDDDLGPIRTPADAHRLQFQGNVADFSSAGYRICRRLNFAGPDCVAQAGDDDFVRDPLCDGDADWFVFTVPEDGMSISVEAIFNHANDNRDLQLFLYEDLSGNPMPLPMPMKQSDVSSPDNSGEKILLVDTQQSPTVAGEYYILVKARGFSENNYGLIVTLSPGLGPDAAEDDDTWQTATGFEVAERLGYDGVGNRTIHAGDEDWFHFPVGVQDGFTIRLMPMLSNPLIEGDRTIGDLTLEVFPPLILAEGETVYGPTAAGPNDFSVVTPDRCVNNDGVEGCAIDEAIPPGLRAVEVRLFAGPFNFLSEDGRWYARVKGLDAEEVGRYQISATMDRQFPLCLDDQAEANNTLATAFNIMTVDAMTQERVQQGGGRELPGGLPVQLTNLNLCDAVTGGEPEGLPIDREDYYRVTLEQGDDLAVTMIRTEPQTLFQENGGSAFAEILDSNGNCVSNLCVCDACSEDADCDPDYVCGDLSGSAVCLKTCIADADCPVRAACVAGQCRPDGDICNVSANNRVSTRANDVVAGEYVVRLGTVSNTRTAYNLELTRTPGVVACSPDQNDNVAPGNETRANATPIATNVVYEALRLCGADEVADNDWYRIELDDESTITAEMTFSNRQGNLNMQLFRGEGLEPLRQRDAPMGEGGESNTDNEKIVLANRSPGVYYLHVYALQGVAGRPNVAYSLRVGVEARAYLCENDEHEFNETIGTAKNLGTSLTSINPRGEVDESGVVSGNSQWLCERNPRDIDMWRFVVRDNQSRVVGIVRSADSGDAFIEVFEDGGGDAPVASTKIDFRGLAKQCIVIPTRAGDAERIFYLSVSSSSITTDDEKMDYALYVEPGEDCAVIPGDEPAQGWPSIAP